MNSPGSPIVHHFPPPLFQTAGHASPRGWPCHCPGVCCFEVIAKERRTWALCLTDVRWGWWSLPGSVQFIGFSGRWDVSLSRKPVQDLSADSEVKRPHLGELWWFSEMVTTSHYDTWMIHDWNGKFRVDITKRPNLSRFESLSSEHDEPGCSTGSVSGSHFFQGFDLLQSSLLGVVEVKPIRFVTTHDDRCWRIQNPFEGTRNSARLCCKLYRTRYALHCCASKSRRIPCKIHHLQVILDICNFEIDLNVDLDVAWSHILFHNFPN